MAYLLVLHLIELEGKCFGDMLFLPVRHAVPELRRLTEMVGKAVAARAYFRAFNLLSIAHERVRRARRMHRAATAEAIGEVSDAAFVDGGSPHRISLIVVNRIQRAIDGQFSKVRTDPTKLSVDVRK